MNKGISKKNEERLKAYLAKMNAEKKVEVKKTDKKK